MKYVGSVQGEGPIIVQWFTSQQWSTLEDSLTINWLGTDQGEEFGLSYGQRLKSLRTTGGFPARIGSRFHQESLACLAGNTHQDADPETHRRLGRMSLRG